MASTSTDRLSGGEAIVRAAIANGVDTFFGLPGAQIYPLFDAIGRSGLPLYVPRHEQAAAYMALGYAKSSGRTGTFCVVPGPGVLNASAALVTAMGTCAPVLCLTGQIPSQYLGRGRGHLHELRDQQATLRTLIKDALRAERPADASAVVNEAVRTLRGGRPGPVAVEMCWDSMAEVGDVRIDAALPPLAAPEIDLDRIDEAAKLVAAARKPMIMCGAGAQHASEEVRALAEQLGCPVTAFRSGRGVLPEDHPLAAPPVAARELWDDVDLLLGIGSRLEMPTMRWGDAMRYSAQPDGLPKLVRIDIDAAEMTRLVPDVAIVADSAAACRQLTDRLRATVSPDAARAAEIATARRTAQSLIRRVQPQTAYLEVIRSVLPRDGFFVPELSQMGFATYTGAFPVLSPRSYVSEGHQGTLGFGFPTALGVKAANPDKAVISINGDGGFLFAGQELATAAQYGLAVVTIVVNNRSFGNVVRDQQTQFGGRLVGSELRNPDFVAFAESFGVEAHRVASPAELTPVLERAVESDAPALIEIEMPPGSETSPWPLIHMRKRPSEL